MSIDGTVSFVDSNGSTLGTAEDCSYCNLSFPGKGDVQLLYFIRIVGADGLLTPDVVEEALENMLQVGFMCKMTDPGKWEEAPID